MLRHLAEIQGTGKGLKPLVKAVLLAYANKDSIHLGGLGMGLPRRSKTTHATTWTSS